ncbi:MAG: hypothetical protein JSR86_01965 [Proteobacteria bacterium]|nr:hypothetical protein [Pseudomonadota bacterium]
MGVEWGPVNDNQAEDRRRELRSRVYLGGKLAFLDNGFTTDCVVRNLSRSGAQVEIKSALPVPAGPFLVVTKYAQGHMTATAWSRGLRCGLILRRSWELADAAQGAPSWIRDLWLELTPRRAGGL